MPALHPLLTVLLVSFFSFTFPCFPSPLSTSGFHNDCYISVLFNLMCLEGNIPVSYISFWDLHTKITSNPNTGMNAINLKQQEELKIAPGKNSKKPNMGALEKIGAL